MKTIIKIFISLSLIYTPYFALASAAEKWTINEVVYDNLGKTLSYTAEKNYGPAANDYKYKAKVPVTASAAGSTALSMIRMGVAGAALYGLVEGVGWIIDNGVVKKKDPQSQIINSPKLFWNNNAYTGSYSDLACKNYSSTFFPTFDQALAQAKTCYKLHYKGDFQQGDIQYMSPTRTLVFNSTRTNYIEILSKSNPNYSPENDIWIPVTPSEMGEQVIDSPSAPQILPDIYSPNNPVSRPSPAPDAAEQALDNAPPIPKEEPKGDTSNKPNKDTDGDGQPDAYDPTLPHNGSEFKLPPACEWIPVVCEWYGEYKQDVKKAEAHAQETKSFWQSVKDWFDWSQADDDLPENESPEIVEHITPDLREDAISWGAACPADVSIPISMQGVTSTLVFSWGPWCQLLSIIKPAIIASAYIGAAFIVLGLRT